MQGGVCACVRRPPPRCQPCLRPPAAAAAPPGAEREGAVSGAGREGRKGPPHRRTALPVGAPSRAPVAAGSHLPPRPGNLFYPQLVHHQGRTGGSEAATQAAQHAKGSAGAAGKAASHPPPASQSRRNEGFTRRGAASSYGRGWSLCSIQ